MFCCMPMPHFPLVCNGKKLVTLRYSAIILCRVLMIRELIRMERLHAHALIKGAGSINPAESECDWTRSRLRVRA